MDHISQMNEETIEKIDCMIKKIFFFFQNVKARHFDVLIFYKDPKTGQVTFAIRRNNIEHQMFDRGYCYTRS